MISKVKIMNTGYLVTLEGSDGVGKSHLQGYIAEALQAKGVPTKIVAEFSDSPSGDIIRGMLEEDRFLRLVQERPISFYGTAQVIADLYFQDEQEVLPALKNGCVVIKDRHKDTLFAYQIPKIQEEHPQMDYEQLFCWINSFASRLRVPDLTFLLTVPNDERLARIQSRGEQLSRKDIEFLERVDNIYSDIAERESRIIPYDNNRNVQEAAAEISDIIITNLGVRNG